MKPTRGAGLARRLAATVYELLLLAAIVVALGFATLPLLNPGSDPTAAPTLGLPSPFARAVSFVLLFAACGAYCVGLWSGGRRTLPMKSWGLALQDATGAPASARLALLRFLACCIAPSCAIVAYVGLRPYGRARWAIVALAINHAWALVDADGKFLQDRIAGTDLVGPGPREQQTAPPGAA